MTIWAYGGVRLSLDRGRCRQTARAEIGKYDNMGVAGVVSGLFAQVTQLGSHTAPVLLLELLSSLRSSLPSLRIASQPTRQPRCLELLQA